jgi:DNA oxidative demethylase
MRGAAERPEGLAYHADVLSPHEERDLLAVVELLELRPVEMRGQVARRTVRHFDLEYGYESWRLQPAPPLPRELEPLRERCAELAGLAPQDLAQTLVTRYPPGATIGWHRDAPVFGPVIVGVSLLSGCVMRFQRRVGGERRVHEAALAPRSVYVLRGSARSAWQHSIPAVPALRYSVTFRTLRGPAAR